MVYGGTTDENIQLNEETFWSGGPHNNNSRKSLENLPKVRELIFNGSEEEAAALINQTFIPGPHGMRFLPMANLHISMKNRGKTEQFVRNSGFEEGNCYDFFRDGWRKIYSYYLCFAG